jgi:O-antigen/teichoic acid export membrane protein
MARKNVIVSFVVKGISIAISLVLVPLTINYINPERYGIWLTVSSVILWFNFFDLGLGNGLRNRLTEAIAQNDREKAKTLISTAYVSLIIIAGVLAIVFFLVNPYIRWDQLLGLSDSYQQELRQLIGVLLIMFCIQFVLQLINTINYAFQKAMLASACFLLGSVFSLIFVLILKETTPGSLFWLGIAFFTGNLLSLLLFTLHFFLVRRRDLLPGLKYVSFSSSKSILNLGSKFFVIQIAAIVQYESTNVLISRWFKPETVTEYNIAYKIFYIILMVFAIIMAPIWSAVTDAQAKGDYSWIQSIERKLLKIWLFFVLIALILLALSPTIYYVWVREVKVPFITSLGVMLYIMAMSFGSIYVNILNGMGRLKTQFYLSIITMLLFIPISYLLAKQLNLGVWGICLALVIVNVNGLIAAPVEFRRIVKTKR